MVSKTVLADVEGFTPLIDMLIEQYNGIITAAVFGRVWRYCQGAYGACSASLQTIADELGLSYATVLRHVKVLCDDGYLEDTTPDLRNRPHTYTDTGKVGLQVSLKAGLSESKSTLSESKGHSVRKTDEDRIRDNKRNKRKKAAAAAKKPNPSTSHPAQEDWTEEDHANFNCILNSWVSEFGKLTVRQTEEMISIYNRYPVLEIHEYAWYEVVKASEDRDVYPNLTYYEKCLATKTQRGGWVVEKPGGNGNGKS